MSIASLPACGELSAQALATHEGRPLRVMQVHSCYGKYCEYFYAAQPHLATQPFSEQMKAWVRDAYAGVHIMTPYLAGCETMLVMSNCLEAQGAWLSAHGAPLNNVEDWQNEIVRQQVLVFQPDVLYIPDSIRFGAEFIRSLPFRPPVIMGWRGADVPLGTDWTGYDVMLSGLPRLLALAESLGAGKGVMFAPGMPSWIAREVEHIPQDVDVVFVGSVYPRQHIHRLALMESLAEGAIRHGFSLALYLLCDEALITPTMRPYVRPPVFGMDMHKALRRGRVVVDDRAYHGVIMPDGSKRMDLGGDDTINMRMFEATGGGSLLLTESFPGVARYFEPGLEVAMYTDYADAVDKVLYYLSHPAERETIAAAGKARCMGEHNMKNRSKLFIEIAARTLKDKKKTCANKEQGGIE